MQGDMDTRALAGFLRARLGVDDEPTVTSITGGRSNLTFRVDVAGERYVLRRPPVGAVLRGAHDIVREYRIMERLRDSGVPVPPVVALCEDPEVLGVPFSLVGFVQGLTLRSVDDLAGLDEGSTTAVTASFASALARLHATPVATAGITARRADDYLARQIHVWRRQLDAEPVRPLPLLEEVADALVRRIPVQRGAAIVHGDYRLDNVLFSPSGEALAVVDWELWTLGGPLGDLAATLSYWQDSPHELAPLGDAPTMLGHLGSRDDLVEAYVAGGGPEPPTEQLAWCYAYGAWRYAAILEGVYRRNLSNAEREHPSEGEWRRLEYVVPALAEVARQHLAAC